MGYREAVLVIHGMGEQRPLDTLDRLAAAIRSEAARQGEVAPLLSRPTPIGQSYEARRYIIRPRFPSPEERAGAEAGGSPTQSRPHRELFEYHWAPKMVGNRIDDLFTITRKILWSSPRDVPAGIRGVWLLLWSIIALVAVAIATSLVLGLDLEPARAWIAAVPGVAVLTAVLSPVLGYVLTKLLPRALTVSFVDVVRYLDNSTRSYDVRRDIRAGAVEILRELNARYDRVTIVAHSLGSYIAYDALRQLWGELNDDYATGEDGTVTPSTSTQTRHVEEAIVALGAASTESAQTDMPWTPYESAQRDLYEQLRADGHRWRITDLITFGSPMYMADRIYTEDRAAFDDRVAKHEFPTCPPQPDDPKFGDETPPDPTDPDAVRGAAADALSYVNRDGRRILHTAAVFAPVRWTNFWFPTKGLSGDFFGGALGPLFGPGIVDVPIDCGGTYRFGFGMPHSRYLEAIADNPDDKVAKLFHDALFARRPRRSIACGQDGS